MSKDRYISHNNNKKTLEPEPRRGVNQESEETMVPYYDKGYSSLQGCGSR